MLFSDEHEEILCTGCHNPMDTDDVSPVQCCTECRMADAEHHADGQREEKLITFHKGAAYA